MDLLGAIRGNDNENFGREYYDALPELSKLASLGRYSRGRYRGPQMRWLGSLFPPISAPGREPKQPKTNWPAPALALVPESVAYRHVRSDEGRRRRHPADRLLRQPQRGTLFPRAAVGDGVPNGVARPQRTERRSSDGELVRREGIRCLFHRVPTRTNSRLKCLRFATIAAGVDGRFRHRAAHCLRELDTHSRSDREGSRVADSEAQGQPGLRSPRTDRYHPACRAHRRASVERKSDIGEEV